MNTILFQFAQSISPGEVGVPVVDSNAALAGVLGLVYFLAGLIAVFVIIIAGYMYVTSGGNPSSVTKAKNAILFAVIGLIVVLLAFVITQFVLGRFA